MALSGRTSPAPELPPSASPWSLYQQIKLARIWFPLAIVGVVLVHQLFIVPLGGAQWQFWSQLLFYSLLGPTATFLTLDWIASEVRRREQAQAELLGLYDELRRSHALLGTIQRVTEQFASATDLDTVLSVAGEGVTAATGAQGTAIFIGARGFRVTHVHALPSALAQDAAARNELLLRGGAPKPQLGGQHVLFAALHWGGKHEGSVHSYFPLPPTPEQRESFGILSSEFSAVAEATRSRTRDLLTLFEADRSIRAEGNLERLLETLLTQTMRRADARMGGVYLADEDGFLQLRASHGVLYPALPDALRLNEGFVGRAAAEAQPSIAHRLNEDERLGPVLKQAGSALSLPLRTEEELLGSIVLAHPDSHHFSEANLPFLNLLAGQVSLAVRNARAYLHSEELAIAEERARIAREIHDGVAQSLAFSALKLDLVSRLLTQPGEAGLEKATAELAATKKTIRESIKEVRRSIFALRPIDLERHGFAETIRRYASDYDQQNDIQVLLNIESAPQLTLKSEAVLFRIFQEAMNNVAKHAKARHVTVTVGKTGDACGFTEVRDDGQGFDPALVSDRVTSAGGLGLKQMRERVQARGGLFEVTSSPGAGTRVYAAVPE